MSLELTVEGGKGGGNGIGCAGGAKPTVLTGTPNNIFSFDSQNKQVQTQYTQYIDQHHHAPRMGDFIFPSKEARSWV